MLKMLLTTPGLFESQPKSLQPHPSISLCLLLYLSPSSQLLRGRWELQTVGKEVICKIILCVERALKVSCNL